MADGSRTHAMRLCDCRRSSRNSNASAWAREATPNYSLHTTGWSFDIQRTYASRAQARAFEFFLERLQSHNLIAWVREPAAIHVTVSADADRLAAVVSP